MRSVRPKAALILILMLAIAAAVLAELWALGVGAGGVPADPASASLSV